MRLGMLTLGIAITASAAAFADAPAAPARPPAAPEAPTAAERWDDSHMQSRYQETPRSDRPRISGQTGYAALANGAPPASEEVSQEIDYTSQRQWVQGSLSGPSRAQQADASNREAQRPGSVHRHGNDNGRQSQLRRGAVHGSSGRR